MPAGRSCLWGLVGSVPDPFSKSFGPRPGVVGVVVPSPASSSESLSSGDSMRATVGIRDPFM